MSWNAGDLTVIASVIAGTIGLVLFGTGHIF